MKNKFFFCFLFLLIIFYRSDAQWVTIPDPAFAAKLQALYPACMNGNQMNTNCSGIVSATSLNVSYLNIYSLEGVQYFNALTTLKCYGNHLTSLPALPSNLIELSCYGNQLVSLPALPATLVTLSCNGNQLSNLPPLPNTLFSFDCNDNQLSSLPPLPDALTFLNCNDNQLDSLPPLPGALTIFYCDSNQLISLPPLPVTLTILACSGNLLSSLPPLPAALNSLWCGSNQLSSLPALPPIMSSLNIANNPLITCLPPLQKIMYSSYWDFYIINTGITCLPNIIQHPNVVSWPAIDTMPVCDLFNANGCEVGYNINGQVVFDADGNCNTGNDAIELNGVQVQLFDNANNIIQSVYTNSLGRYSFDTNLGIYKTSLDTNIIPFQILCPASVYYTSNLIPSDSMDVNLDFKLICNGSDLAVLSTVRDSGILRPARKALIRITSGNANLQYGAYCGGNSSGSLKAVINGPAMYNGVATGSLVPNYINGDTLIWNIADWSTVNTNSFHFRLLTDPLAIIGAQTCITAIVSSDSIENNVSNNMFTYCFNIVNSYDPNVKEVSPSHLEQTSQWLTYTIHFQNTGTAAAEHVQVQDTLDANLDWSSFNLLSASHDNITQVYNTIGIVKFNFPNINLPDSTNDEPNSHGWIQYRIKTKSNLIPPVQIHNTASIYFDLNNPVMTNDAVADLPCSVPGFSFDTSVCNGDSYNFYGNILTASGIYDTTLITTEGCDSIITLNLTVNDAINTQISISICDGEAYLLDGFPYSSAGTYFATMTSSLGCDSSITLYLTVNQPNNSEVFDTICNGEILDFNGDQISSAGVYFHTLTNATGCDSVITLNLEVKQPSASELNESICAGEIFDFNGTPISNGGTYAATILNAVGCDSVITLHLTIETIDTTVSTNNNILTATANATSYQWIDCSNNQNFTGETAQTFTATSNGIYAVLLGNNGCSVQSECVNVIGLSVEELIIDNGELAIYPNPVHDNLFIEGCSTCAVNIIDVQGRVIIQSNLYTESNRINVSALSNGIYIAEIVNHEVVVRRKFLKQD